MKTPKTTIEGHPRVEVTGRPRLTLPYTSPDQVPQSLRTTVAKLVCPERSDAKVAEIFGLPVEWVRLFKADLDAFRRKNPGK